MINYDLNLHILVNISQKKCLKHLMNYIIRFEWYILCLIYYEWDVLNTEYSNSHFLIITSHNITEITLNV